MTFQELLEVNDYKTRSYSGRGMWGEECLAITIDSYDFPQELMYIGSLCILNNVALPRKISWDTLGRSNYVVYFRDHDYKEPDEDDEQDNPDTGDN